MKVLSTVVSIIVAVSALVPSVKNLRPVVPGKLYRSATLDNLSPSDSKLLLSDGSAFGIASKSLAAVIDLRNEDEVRKGMANRTEGSKLFYSSSDDGSCNFLHIPILEDIDAFWEEAINRMDTKERLMATMKTVFQGGALDRAAARTIEQGGHAMLNTIMMISGRDKIREALEACLQESSRGPVIFHCQKGKDRTGVLSMLIQCIMDSSEGNIISDYALSGTLLGEEEGDSSENGKIDGESSALIDWRYFRGSPAKGMADTLEWTRANFGSVESYLTQVVGLDASFQKRFRNQLSLSNKEEQLEQ